MTSAYQYFCQIRDKSTTKDNRYQVISLPDSHHKLGVSEEGFPKFFVETIDHNTMQNLNAELLSVEYNMPCNIIEGAVVYDNKRFTIITLRSENEQFQKMFVEVFLLMLTSLPQQPSNIELETPSGIIHGSSLQL